jgi:hypothetical protein
MQLPKDINTLQKQLADREAELDIINSVQLALASKLDVQAIYDLVGDKNRDIFDSQVVMISTYDKETDTMEHRYAIECGERINTPGRFPVKGFRTQIVKTRQPVLVSTNVGVIAAELGQPTLPGTITPKTWLVVPMLVGGEVADPEPARCREGICLRRFGGAFAADPGSLHERGTRKCAPMGAGEFIP